MVHTRERERRREGGEGDWKKESALEATKNEGRASDTGARGATEGRGGTRRACAPWRERPPRPPPAAATHLYTGAPPQRAPRWPTPQLPPSQALTGVKQKGGRGGVIACLSLRPV